MAGHQRVQPGGLGGSGRPQRRSRDRTVAERAALHAHRPQAGAADSAERRRSEPASFPRRLLRRRRLEEGERELDQDEQRRSRAGPVPALQRRGPGGVRLCGAPRGSHVLSAQPALRESRRREGPAPHEEPRGGAADRRRRAAGRRMGVRPRDGERRLLCGRGASGRTQLSPPRPRVRDAQDHLARGRDQARDREGAEARQPRRGARLGLCEGLRRGDVADAAARRPAGLRDRDRRGALGARVLPGRLRRGGAGRLRALRDDRPGVRAPRRGGPPDRGRLEGRARARLEAADELRAADQADDARGHRAAGELSAMAVPLFDTTTQLAPLRDELRAAVARVLDSERYILGPEVAAFEQEFAAYCGAAEAVGVANGTEAITIALRALGVGPGDEVVVPSFTFYASAEAIPPTGARPVFCDVDPDTYCVTAETVRAALTPNTKAVIAVHLFGNVAPIAEI